MNRNAFWYAFIALFFSLNSFGQNHRLQIVVRDSVTGKSLEGVVAEIGSAGTDGKAGNAGVSDVRGRIFFSLPGGNYRLQLRMLGYAPLISSFNLDSDQQLDFLLSPRPVNLGEVEVASLMVNRLARDLPAPVAVVGAMKYKKLSSFTLSNVLATEPGIAMGNDGVWATNINIRDSAKTVL
ncbi:MAG: hypothetical protein IPI69_00835 [Bacteroidales bacterium]|nr:hypothetical protein [Bacteroidales bacterium]